jgi:hypothetical protein
MIKQKITMGTALYPIDSFFVAVAQGSGKTAFCNNLGIYLFYPHVQTKKASCIPVQDVAVSAQTGKVKRGFCIFFLFKI